MMADNSYISPEVCSARMRAHDERFNRDKERLDKHERKIETISDATIRITELLTRYDESIKDCDGRISTLESRPGALWDRAVGGLISAIVGGLAAALVALVIK